MRGSWVSLQSLKAVFAEIYLYSFLSFAILKNFGKIIESSAGDIETSQIQVFSTSYPHELIAMLNIRITGMSFLRDLAIEWKALYTKLWFNNRGRKFNKKLF